MTESQAEIIIEENLDQIYDWLYSHGDIPCEYITCDDNYEEDSQRYVEDNKIQVVEDYQDYLNTQETDKDAYNNRNL